MTDNVNHPSHYNAGMMETIDVIQGALTQEEFRGFMKGNIIKYISRAEHKNGVEDLQKARWYLGKLIKKAKKDEAIKNDLEELQEIAQETGIGRKPTDSTSDIVKTAPLPLHISLAGKITDDVNSKLMRMKEYEDSRHIAAQDNCPYCHNKENLGYIGDVTLKVDTFRRYKGQATLVGNLKEHSDFKVKISESLIGINYCPMCGRKLIKTEEE